MINDYAEVLMEEKTKRPVAIGAHKCPFCGSNDIRISETKFLLKGYHLKGDKSLRFFCRDCGVNTGDKIYKVEDEASRIKAFEKALQNWNKRVSYD